ncbi:MAG TPA: ATP-binding protein [Sumerlaeia bacterium]|nr:ATP-binding protein [Sumerlaeia bacterium]
MRIAVASGKGGTGKTTVATNLAYVASRDGRSVAYVDCDVEEPNGHIFLKPEIAETRPVSASVPVVDEEKCAHCGQCGEICQFSAIVCIGKRTLTYPGLCHSCGGCALVCPEGAVSETPRTVGKAEIGAAGPLRFAHGFLEVGEAMSPPVIEAVKRAAPAADLTILDAPPGTSCPVIASIRHCDFLLLVTEPTPFGLHDLKLAVRLARALGMAFGVLINRADLGDDSVGSYCRAEGIPILAEIPDDRRVAEAYSRGELICEAVPGYAATFASLLESVLAASGKEAGA